MNPLHITYFGTWGIKVRHQNDVTAAVWVDDIYIAFKIGLSPMPEQEEVAENLLLVQLDFLREALGIDG